MARQAERILVELSRSCLGKNPVDIKALFPSGSSREYYRLFFDDSSSVIGVWNIDFRENNAFLSLSRHFDSLGLSVPKVLAVHPDGLAYLLQDLGDVTFLQFLHNHQFYQGVTQPVREMYHRVVSELPLFQIRGSQGLDYSVCYPRSAFDRQSMMWDLSYFKYYFLKLGRVPFDEQKLEVDFQSLCDFLLEADDQYFLYRDFQSRNVMIHDGIPFFIDYQGGRRGALQYDIASVLFEAKTNLSPDFRQELLDVYLDALQNLLPVSKDQFMLHFYGFVYIRTMQAMGAYGFRGLYEKKPLFLQSIPLAVKNLQWLRDHIELPIELPELKSVWSYIATSPDIYALAERAAESVPEISEGYVGPKAGISEGHSALTITIVSFSYRKGIPTDDSGNGGGFVFDCRAVDNPGRLEVFRELTGRDAAVKQSLSENPLMCRFLEHVYALVDASVENYMGRGFSHLQVSFGCTGGQHRSVFAADQLADRLKKKYAVRVLLKHREQHINESY